jgi:hypothetical protein
VAATVLAFSACLSAEPAAAHVDLRPDLVEQGEVVEIRIELPPIEPGAEVVRLEIEGDGIAVLSTRRLDLPGPESHWTARLRVDAPIGRAPFLLRPVYADGGRVAYRQALTVVPAQEGAFPLALVLVGAGAAVTLAGAALFLLRRRA